MPKTFDFPVWLKGTPEQQAAEHQRQGLLRASFTRARQTEAERLIGRGVLIEKTARGNIDRTKEGSRQRVNAENMLAEGWAMQGHYKDAAAIHHDPARKKHFNSLVSALQMDDSEKCSCADTKTSIDGVELLVTPRFERQRIYSVIHGEVVSVIICSKCGHTNARKARSRLLPQQAALAQAEATKRPILSDKQVLHVKK